MNYLIVTTISAYENTTAVYKSKAKKKLQDKMKSDYKREYQYVDEMDEEYCYINRNESYIQYMDGMSLLRTSWKIVSEKEINEI